MWLRGNRGPSGRNSCWLSWAFGSGVSFTPRKLSNSRAAEGTLAAVGRNPIGCRPVTCAVVTGLIDEVVRLRWRVVGWYSKSNRERRRVLAYRVSSD